MNNQKFIEAFKLMSTSRILDKKMMNLLKQGKAYFHMGAAGHEAVQSAMAMLLNIGQDWIYPYYRDQVLCLGLKMPIKALLQGFLAKEDDPSSGGRQLPHHYGYKPSNIVSSSSSVGTQFLQAVGTALANKKTGQRPFPVTVVCGGEGSTSQGEFYEAINWATVDKLPIIFLIQNNEYAISVPSSIQKPNGNISVFGKMYEDLLSYKIDGCNFAESLKCSQLSINHARNQGPVFIDAHVVRIAPHSSSDNHNLYRTDEDINNMQLKDPISQIKSFLIKSNIITPDDINNIEKEISDIVDQEIKHVLQERDPEPDTATSHIFSSDPIKTSKAINELNLDKSTEFVFIDAINKALREEMEVNDKIYVFGEDVAEGKGGVFKATRDLTKIFGKNRCFNTQLAEASIIGSAIGMAVRGLKPVVEIQFGDYIWPAMAQIRNELSTMRYRSNNNFKCPMVIRTPIGGYIHGGLCHSQNIEAFFSHIPGLRVVEPSNALDAYGLLKYAIRCDDPILFLEHKLLYRQKIASSFLPKEDWEFSIKQARVKKHGNSLTIISYGYLIYKTLNAVTNIEKKT
jgi:2-oxoisovalerate dehydrogenase E1 component